MSNFLTKGRYNKGGYLAAFTLFVCFSLSYLYWNSSNIISSQLSANYHQVFNLKEYWRLFTTSFVHADLNHLLSNSLMLAILLYFVASYYGAFFTFLISFLFAIVNNGLVLSYYGANSSLVGASGVVYFLWGFWMLLYLCIQNQYSLIHRILRVGAVFLILLVPTEYQPKTSYLAHYLGFLIGVLCAGIYYIFQKKKIKSYERWTYTFESNELSALDEIALSYSNEEHQEL